MTSAQIQVFCCFFIREHLNSPLQLQNEKYLHYTIGRITGVEWAARQSGATQEDIQLLNDTFDFFMLIRYELFY